MKNFSKFLSVLFIIGIISFACEKEDEQTDNNNSNGNDNGEEQVLEFESLVAENDSIPFDGDTKIIATASGKDLSYSWKTTQGELFPVNGKANERIFAADPCETGVSTITVTVTDAFDESETKSVDIYVYI